mgnify:CR=1 FL=1
MGMNVNLPPSLEEMVRAKVGSGMYASVSEVVREALRLLEERDRIQALRFEEVRKEIQAGIDQADRGETAPLDVRETLKKVRGRRKNGPGTV